jgi:hypothetical protein
VDLQTLPDMLDELLLEAGDDGIEVCLSQAATVPPPERDAVDQEYETRYARAVEAMGHERGPPTFVGCPEDLDYPVWHRGARLSYWQNAAGFVYVALCQELNSVRLVAGARPHPFERDTVTLLPPAD